MKSLTCRAWPYLFRISGSRLVVGMLTEILRNVEDYGVRSLAVSIGRGGLQILSAARKQVLVSLSECTCISSTRQAEQLASRSMM